MNDGGQAFPVSNPPGWNPGMSLRDYFAAKAMADVLHGFNWEKEHVQKAAALSYEIADAMLTERGKLS